VQRNLLVLFAAGLLFWSDSASLLPTLPLYLQHNGASMQEIGFVMGSFAIGLLLFRPKFGRLADKRGRKLVLLIGTIVATIVPLGYLVVKSVPLLMGLRILEGLSVAAFATGFNTMIADFAPSKRYGEIICYMGLVHPLGMAIGPALGGYVQAEFGSKSIFLCAAGLGLVALLCVVQTINAPNPLVEKQQPQSAKSSKFWEILLSPQVRVPAEILLLVGLGVGTLQTFVPLYIKSITVQLNVGLFYTAAAIACFSVQLFVGQASDRLGRGLFITLSLVCYSLAMVLLWQANSPVSFLLAACCEGIGGMLFSVLAAMMADRSLPQERGRMYALYSLGWDMGMAMAGPVFGFIATQVGYRNMFGCDALLIFLALVIFFTKSSKTVSSSVRFALGLGQDVYALNRL
jgi:MFS family permease